MNKKTLAIIALVTGILLLIGALGYFVFVSKPELISEPTESAPTSTSASESTPIPVPKNIITFSENTPEWNKLLKTSAIRTGCSEGYGPNDCVSYADEWVRAVGINKYSLDLGNDPYKDPITKETFPALQDFALQLSRLSVDRPNFYAIFLDDFAGMLYKWYNSPGIDPATIPPILNSIIDNTKSANHKLKFGITIYEEEIDDPAGEYIDDTYLPQNIKAKIDYVSLYLHYRENYVNYENYVRKTKEMFPNAKVIAGSYPYDRIDYIDCSPKNPGRKCSTEEEINLYKKSLELQSQLLRKGIIDGIEFCCIGFGEEEGEHAQSIWNDPQECKPERKQACINNTKIMHKIVLDVLNSEFKR